MILIKNLALYVAACDASIARVTGGVLPSYYSTSFCSDTNCLASRREGNWSVIKRVVSLTRILRMYHVED